ncbi:hypothetical protein [Bacillus cereus]|uniref:hypothetical protein n=1 Tax=Bacillus cereus TaxID=1396 RepID=UPI0001A18656|nr:hypothetical protein [Bacillus cereus]ALL11658.1 hypothetical protein BTXL6_27685 [Bacillus thuringiensis]EEM19149.1 hypothetical protein bthur0001_57880 [Bacillus thuringiensis serovar tochigiensis BGSC 4Y1]PFJ30714.1 hypothetical protein COI92_06920 [Bacillus anthracis]ALL21797.1 hypothetical protein BTXL6_10120 [Bacillus thuringiensis]EJR72631.1 hypothetical protein IK9_05406 [Bacillus cereus VD166]
MIKERVQNKKNREKNKNDKDPNVTKGVKRKVFNDDKNLYIYFVDSEGNIALIPSEVPVRYFKQFIEQHKNIYIVAQDCNNNTLFELRDDEIFKIIPRYRKEIYHLLEEVGIDTREAKNKGI